MAGIKQIGTTTGIKKRKPKRPSAARTTNQDKEFLALLDEHLKGKMSPHRGNVFYPSALGSTCDRYLYASFNGLLPWEDLDPRVKRIFDVGSGLEDRMTKYFTKMNILKTREYPVSLDSPPISGRLDFLVIHPTKGEAIVELKSINEKGFKELKHAPKHDHLVQLQIYLNLLNKDYGIVLYENKNDQTLKAFKVDRDVTMWEKLLERCVTIMNMLQIPEVCTGDTWCKCKGVKNGKL
jgi:hypothetical protein